MADGTPKKDPTAAEAKFFFSIVKNLKAKADIDWDAVAVDQNFKSAEVAKVRFGQVKRKLGIFSEGATPKNGGTTPTKVAKNGGGRSGGKKGSTAKAKGKATAVAEASTPSRVKREEDVDHRGLYEDDDDDEGETSGKGSFVLFKREPDEEEEDERKFDGLMSEADPFA